MGVQQNGLETAETLFRKQGGMLRASEAIALGIHPRTLYRLRDEDRLVMVSRGLYRLADLPELSDPDLVSVATRIPQAVVCLVSALAFHEITTEIPHEVSIALPRTVKRPRLDYPPLRVFWFSGAALTEGIEEHKIDGVAVKIYGPEKTVADCFKFRNKIGLDVAIEALKLCRARVGSTPRKLLHYARICRVERVMRPYLEALG
ncbi:MAG: type IV toxin-antitoxin system AbiEi family antitoxin domain-containing protein [Blastocatellales bacterium]